MVTFGLVLFGFAVMVGVQAVIRQWRKRGRWVVINGQRVKVKGKDVWW
jgi:hypothetical protein